MAIRENWSTRTAFILAAAGSAIGLGNIWRFPYVAYENGGGAFLIPYLVAIFTAALPLLILDYSVGHKYRKSPPMAYRQITPKAEALGWWQVAVCLFIAIYYASILSWAASYTYFSIGQKWGVDPSSYFFSNFLQNSEQGFVWSFIPHLAWPLIFMWVVIMWILYGGIRKGVELANKICIPLLIVLFFALVLRSLSLPGAVDGLNTFFTPNWSAIKNHEVWLAAYGHVFFSLSLGFGIMVTYASYLKRKVNLTGVGFTVAFANSSFELLAGIGVFAALGFMAFSSGQPVTEVVSNGIGLAFIAFPTLISSFSDGIGGTIFGILFFGSLVLAGISSLVSVLQVPISAMQDKLGWSKNKAVTIVGGKAALFSIILFSSQNAISVIDIMDHFINNIGVVGGGLASIILVSWFFRKFIGVLQQHVNAISSIKIGPFWNFMISLVAPASLSVALLFSLYGIITKGYGEYSSQFLLIFGWGSILLCLIFALVMTMLKTKDKGE